MTERPARLDEATVMRMATTYLSRYAASSQHLRHLLDRKIRRWSRIRQMPLPDDGAIAALIEVTVVRLVEGGMIDDTAYALARARRLIHKGLPQTRIRNELRAKGLDVTHALLDAASVPDSETQAQRFAARKRLGPFRSGPRAPFRDKDIRTLLRAGFGLREAIAVIGTTIDERPMETFEEDPSE